MMSGMAEDIIRDFSVDIPEAELDDLRARLAATRYPDQLPGTSWERGTDLAWLQDLVEYWRTGYDWRVWEKRINAFPQFTTTIDGANVHFLHVRSANPDALPVVLTHGWPGSVAEFLEVIEPLSRDFHLVVPSLPGYGFSGPTTDLGWDIQRVARAWATLMARLGYDRYGVQGGDWGSMVSRSLGQVDPEHVAGVHLNFLIALPDGPHELDADEQERMDGLTRYLTEGSGYTKLHQTRPQTLSYALTDSPAGQLAWVAEKFHEWTDDPTVIDRDHLLTNVMIYWLTKTAGSAARLYYETFLTMGFGFGPSTAPTGVAVFAKEIIRPIRRFAEASNNIVQWTEYDRGGHFAAMEAPDLWLDDVRRFFRSL